MNNFVKFHPLNGENKPAVFILYLYMILFSVIYREMIRFVRRIRGKCWVTFQVLVFLLIYIQISTADGPFQLKLRVGGGNYSSDAVMLPSIEGIGLNLSLDRWVGNLGYRYLRVNPSKYS